MPESKSVKNTAEKEQEKDSNSQRDNLLKGFVALFFKLRQISLIETVIYFVNDSLRQNMKILKSACIVY